MRTFVKTQEIPTFNGGAPQCIYSVDGWIEAGFDLPLIAYGDELPVNRVGTASTSTWYNDYFDILDLKPIRALGASREGKSPNERTMNERLYVFECYGIGGLARNHGIVVASYRGGDRINWLRIGNSGAAASLLPLVATLDEQTALTLVKTILEAQSYGENRGSSFTAYEWKRAYMEGRIRKRRGSNDPEIEAAWETQRRLERKAARAA